MTSEDINESTASFPFRQIKGSRGIKFQQTRRRPGSKEGIVLSVEHNGHNHVTLDFRELYETKGGRQGNRRTMLWTLDAKSTVAFASVLFLLAEKYMRDGDEQPFYRIVDKEKAGFGPNWINEEYDTAIKRTETRKARSHLFGLMQRCVETCEDSAFVQFLAMNLAMWAEQSGDEFAVQQAEKALFQLGMVKHEVLDS